MEDAEGPDADAEPELGWQNIGPQLRLVIGDEGDGNCDAEPDDPDYGVDDVPHDPEEFV